MAAAAVPPADGTAPTAGVAAASSPSTARLLDVLAIPPLPGFVTPGAWVEHVLAPQQGLLSEIVTEVLSLPEGAAALLLRFGAVHTCPVPPAVPAAVLAEMPAEQAAAALARRQAAIQRAGNSSQARTPQRATADAVVAEHAYIRVHLHPKRFPAAYSVDWKERVVADAPGFVVVSKPAGVPAAPTVDNLLECAPSCTAEAIGHPEQALLITHRLDQCTEGLLVLGKTKEFVRQFNEVIKQGSNSGSSGDGSGGGRGSGNGAGSESDGAGGAAQNRGSGGGVAGRAAAARPLRKFYRAATAAAPPLGLLRHRLSIERRQQGLPSFTVAHEWEEEVEGSLPAELRVLEVAPIRLSEAAARQWGAQPGSPAHECLIELLTGRTHQIRAQLSAVGCPLLGDVLYQPLASPTLRQRMFRGDPCDDLRSDSGRLLDEPPGGIGLQACRLEVTAACMGGSPEAPVVFEAGMPWWRS